MADLLPPADAWTLSEAIRSRVSCHCTNRFAVASYVVMALANYLPSGVNRGANMVEGFDSADANLLLPAGGKRWNSSSFLNAVAPNSETRIADASGRNDRSNGALRGAFHCA